jgi:hypothetical protein
MSNVTSGSRYSRTLQQVHFMESVAAGQRGLLGGFEQIAQILPLFPRVPALLMPISVN